MAEASLALKFQENMSEGLTALRTRMTPFRQDLSELQRELNVLTGTKVELKMDLDRAKQELAAAKKAFADLNDETADDTAVRDAQARYEQLSAALREVSTAANRTQRDMRDAADVSSRADNRAGSRNNSNPGPSPNPDPDPDPDGGGDDDDDNEPGMLAQLAKAGFIQMAGDAVAEVATTMVGSAFGDDAGTMFSSILGGMASGAAMGSIIPVVGTAVGAAVGGTIGLLSGGNAIFQKQDDAFKDHYQGLYDTVESDRLSMTQEGAALASQREMDAIAFSKLLGGEESSASYLDDLRDMANRTPFDYSDLTGMSRSLAPAFGDDPERMLSLMQAIGDAGASVGLDTSGMQMVGTAISRMESTGKTSLEYLNLLQERGIDAYGFLADGLGKSKEDMLEMVSKGLIPGAEAAMLIQEGMEGAYMGAMELQGNTYSGLTSTVEGLRAELAAAKGQGYNDTRLESLNAEVAYLDGEVGQQLQEAYRQIGEWEASIENERVRIEQDVMTAVMTGVMPEGYEGESAERIQDLIDQYTEVGSSTGEVMARAQALSMSLYYESEGYQELVDYQTSLARGIRDDAYVLDSWRDAGYSMGQVFSEGMLAAAQSIYEPYDPYDTPPSAVSKVSGDNSDWRSRAMGQETIPYDNFPALLHQGERVLTAREVRQADEGAAASKVVVTGNTFTIREEADVDRVAQALLDKIIMAKLAGSRP